MAVYSVILIALSVLNVVVHVLGIYALISLYNDSLQKPQRLLLISTSCCEAVQNVVFALHTQLLLSDLDQLTYYAATAAVGLRLLLYLNMAYIAVERLAKFILNMNYPQYWNANRTKYLLMTTWLLVSVSTLVACASYGGVSDMGKTLNVLYATLDIVFVAIAVSCYGIIICRYKSSVESVKQKLKRSVYIVPCVLVATLVLFFLTPDLIAFSYRVVNVKVPFTLQVSCAILKSVTFFTHAVVYVVLLKDVARFLRMKGHRILSMVARGEARDDNCRNEQENNLEPAPITNTRDEANVKLLFGEKSIDCKKSSKI